MDTNYIINRLKSTPFKYSTAAFLKTRLNNLDTEARYLLLQNLKKQLYKESNCDIQDVLAELVYRLPEAS